MLIYEQSQPGRRAFAQAPKQKPALDGIPAEMRRSQPAALPEVSEMQAVRHYTRLSQKNFSIDTEFYPLGSCTMKYNPRACNVAGHAGPAPLCSGVAQSGISVLHVRVAGDAQGRHRHEVRVAGTGCGCPG